MLIFYSKSVPANDPSFWPDYWQHEPNEFNENFMPEYALFRRHVQAGAKVLDAGCGTGFATRAMLAQGYHAVGIDFDELSVTRSARERGYFPAAVADVTRLPYGNGVFDATFICSVAEHVPSGAQTAIRECARVLRSDGTIVVTLPYVNVVRRLYAPFYRIAAKVRARHAPLKFNQYVYTRREVIRLLQESGFDVVECRRSHYMTVLLRIPGVKTLQRLAFGTPADARPATSIKTAQAAAPSRRGLKATLKPVAEGLLNAVIPNRLTVVARKTA